MSVGTKRQQRYRERKSKDRSKPLNFYVSEEVHEKLADLRDRSKRTDLLEAGAFTLEKFFTTWVDTITAIIASGHYRDSTIDEIAEHILKRIDLRRDDSSTVDTFIDVYGQIQRYFPEEFPLSPMELQRCADLSIIR